jgi:hypothetical protein
MPLELRSRLETLFLALRVGRGKVSQVAEFNYMRGLIAATAATAAAAAVDGRRRWW